MHCRGVGQERGERGEGGEDEVREGLSIQQDSVEGNTEREGTAQTLAVVALLLGSVGGEWEGVKGHLTVGLRRTWRQLLVWNSGLARWTRKEGINIVELFIATHDPRSVYLVADWLLSSRRASSNSGSEPFTHVYTTSMGSSGQRLYTCTGADTCATDSDTVKSSTHYVS